MNCPICKKPLLIERISVQTLAIAEEVTGLNNLSDLQYEASQVIDSLSEQGDYFRCCSCMSDLKMSEQEVINLISTNSDYGKRIVA
jgi:hypothetical protein